MFYLEEHNPQANRESSSFPGRIYVLTIENQMESVIMMFRE